MNVLILSPGYPGEMPHFTAGLARAGARVLGLSDQPEEALPPKARRALSGYRRVRNLFDEEAVTAEVVRWSRETRIDRVECLWEVGMLVAGRIRDALGLPGLGRERTLPFRDKERMKLELDAAGLRTPSHARATRSDEVRAAAERIGYPLIVKPIAGGGSADTYRVDNGRELESILPRLRNVREVSVEEFVEGDEFTYDTICIDGRVAYENVSWYRPRPLEEKTFEWISPQTFCLRDLDADLLAGGRRLGRDVLRALGFGTGFTHMEWFRKPDGEVVFGEIGARPPGARMVDLMNYAGDVDLFDGWAEAVVSGRFSQPRRRPYNTVMVVKRARGRGRIRAVVGLDRVRTRFGAHLVADELLPVGSPRRDWKATSISDGYLILRHPELQATIRMADEVARTVQLFAR